MAQTLKFGNGNFATKAGSTLCYDDQNGNFKPIPMDFTRASTATRVNKQGLIEVVKSNVPRIDFLGNTKGSLKIEPTRTNIFEYSEDGSQWSTTNATLSLSSDSLTPSGQTQSYKVSDTTQNAQHRIAITQAVVSGVEYTFSAFVKQEVNSDTDFAYLLLANRFTSTTRYYFNIKTGIAGNGNGIIENYGNGWYKISGSATANSTGNAVLGVNLSNSNGTPTYTGTGNGSMFVWGLQMEAGSYATSYIPTLGGSSETRIRESNTLASPISLDNNFSLFWEGLVLENDIMLYGSGTNAWYMNYETATGRIILDEANGGRKIQAYLGSGAPARIKTKILLIRNNGVHSIFANGTKRTANISVDSTSTLSLSSMFWSFSSSFNKGLKVNDSQIFKIALTDAEAISLTTI